MAVGTYDLKQPCKHVLCSVSQLSAEEEDVGGGKLGVNVMRRVWAISGSRWAPTESEGASVCLSVKITGSQVRDGGFHAIEGAEFANLCFVTVLKPFSSSKHSHFHGCRHFQFEPSQSTQLLGYWTNTSKDTPCRATMFKTQTISSWCTSLVHIQVKRRTI